MEDQYDSVLLSILQNEGEIVNFLDVILGFLYRKTDFYKLLRSRSDKMGFPPGVARKFLLNEFDKFEKLAKENDPTYQDEPIKKTKAETVSTTKEDTIKQIQKQEVKKLKPNEDVKSPQTEEKSKPPEQKIFEKIEDSTAKQESVPASGSRSEYTVQTSRSDTMASTSNSDENIKENDDENPELTRQQKIFQNNPESYNGAIRDHYSWSQHIEEVDAYVKIPPYIKKGKDVKVVLEKCHLKVGYVSNTGETVTVVDGALLWEVNKEESIWSLVPGLHVHVNMEKKEERWWESLFTDEPKISVRKIDASRPITDLDDEAQAKIEEMMYNEHRKRLGLPQTHEEKMYETMKKAWNAEGSPFKGQPFDPSAFSVNSSGIVTINQPQREET